MIITVAYITKIRLIYLSPIRKIKYYNQKWMKDAGIKGENQHGRESCKSIK